MEKKQYSEAMLILGDIAKTEPDKLERVYQLMNRINKIWNQYTDKLEKLIQEEDDYEKILASINELVNMNPNLDSSGMVTLELAKNRAKRIGNRNYFNDLMDEVRVLINKEDYYNAVKKYAGAFVNNPSFDLHKNEYASAKLGNIIKPTIDEKINAINQNIDKYLEKTLLINKNINKITSDWSVLQYADMQNLVDQIISGFLEILEMASIVKSSSGVLDLQKDKLITMGNSSDIINSVNYLTYFRQLITGRTAYKESEGILNVMNIMVNNSSNAIMVLIKTQADENFSRGMEQFAVLAYDQSQALIQTAGDLYTLVAEMAYFTDKKEKLMDYSMITKTGWNFDAALANYLKAVVDTKSAHSYQVLIDELEELSYFTEISSSPDKSLMEPLKIEIIRIINSVREITEDWQTYLLFGGIALGRDFNKEKADTIINFSGTIISRFLKEYLRIGGVIFSDFIAEINNEITLLEKGVASPKDYNGITITILKYFPGERKTAFTMLKNEISDFEENITEINENLAFSKELIAASTEFKNVISDLGTFSSNIDRTMASLDEYIVEADTRIRDGQKFKDEGKLRLQQAQTALNRLDYINARKRISDASIAFDKSLEKSEDEEVRRSREVTLLELDKKVINAENEIVVREVRQFLKEGRDFYSRGLYDEAESTLLRAQSRLADVKAEKDIEIEEWLGYVRTAKKIKSARVISETDPLYKEMTQLSDYANKNYSEGLALKKSGNKTEAARLFDEADKKVISILLSFPYNNDARVMRLKIMRESDPAAFNDEIKKRFNDARQLLASNIANDQREGYNSLRDILAIDPNNKAVINEIVRAEYKLKIRLPEPDPKDMAESKKLTQDAKKIVDTKNIDLFPAALALVNEAIKLDTNNELAKRLKDDIYLLEGGKQTSVISKAAMDLYDRALEYYLTGNYTAANQVVTDAWGDPRNQGYRKLQELKEKIEAKL